MPYADLANPKHLLFHRSGPSVHFNQQLRELRVTVRIFAETGQHGQKSTFYRNRISDLLRDRHSERVF